MYARLFVARYSQRIALLNEAWHNCALRASRISQRASFLPSSRSPMRAGSHTYRPQSTQCRRITGARIDTSILAYIYRDQLDKMFILSSAAKSTHRLPSPNTYTHVNCYREIDLRCATSKCQQENTHDKTSRIVRERIKHCIYIFPIKNKTQFISD